jgi:hypothetical protein
MEHRVMPSRLHVMAILILPAMLLAACDVVRQVGTRSWAMAETNQAGTGHTITVTDRSGRVEDVTFAPADADLVKPVSVPATAPDAIDVVWTGGACDAATSVDVASAGAGLEVTVAIEANGMECDSVGLPQVVRLTLAESVAPGLVKVSQ